MRTFSLCVLLACGGSRSTTETPEATPVTTAPSPAAEGALAVAGDLSPWTIIGVPARWPELRDAMRAMVPGELPRDLEELFAMTSYEQLIGKMGGRGRRTFSELQGVDPTRPAVLRFAEVMTDDFGALLEVTRETSYLRHVLAIPAADAAALEADLRSREDHGERFWVQRDGDYVFAVFAEHDRPTPPDMTRLRSDTPPSAVLRFAFRDHPVAMHLRGSRLQPYATAIGAEMMTRALHWVEDAEQLAAMRTVGTAELLGARARTEPSSHEIAEVALAVVPGPAPRIDGMARLTVRGRDALAAGIEAPPVQRGVLGAPIGVRTGISFPAAAQASGMPVGYEGLQGRELTRAFQRCGFACAAASLAQPFSAARTVGVRPLRELDEAGILALAAGEPTRVDADLDLMALARLSREREIVAMQPRPIFLRTEVRGGAWFGSLALEATAAEGALDGLRAEASTIEALEVPRSEGYACLVRYMAALADGLEAYANVSPESRASIVSGIREEVEPHRSCAAADPANAAELATLESLIPDPNAPPPTPEPEPVTAP